MFYFEFRQKRRSLRRPNSSNWRERPSGSGNRERRIREVIAGVAQMTGARIDLDYQPGYPVTINHPSQTKIAIEVARKVAGEPNVLEMPPMMAAEDFAYMLEARPGAYIFCGNGESAGLHHPAYNFNDDAIVFGTSYWIRLVEYMMAPK